ncbi:MAG TPA: sulfatase-like hydrolase/transferase [Candidatus Brocadiia bacterium]|nr:sulfatase-like hydrolase/transferase [Candidatus Brocadiia bacterium]
MPGFSDLGRRDFLRAAIAGAFAAGTGARHTVAAPGKRPPNVLFIMSDEHNASITGCYGNRTVRTPHLDALSATGITFDCAYTASPLCVPSRLAFTSGKYISHCRAWNNDCRLPSDDYPSIARIMNAAGYESFLCGKQHYDSRHRYGFTEIGGNMNNGRMTGVGQRRAADDTTVNTEGRDQRFAHFKTADDSSVMSHDRAVTAGALNFLSKRKSAEKPFFLFLGYLAPHFPLTIPRKYWEPYRDNVPMPVLPPGHVESQPLNYHHLRRGFGVVETDPKLVKLGRELYYGFTQWVDEEIGKVLTALAASGVGENTVIIYTTDHGENMGEHALWWKNCVYDTAARVPLIISWPERWKGGQRRKGACSMVDVTRTVADIGGANAPDDWDGDSLAAWMDDPGLKWKDMAVSQYYAHNIASGYAMLRSGDFKYVYHSPPDDRHPAQHELYDMARDPGEFANLAESPSHAERIVHMHEILVKEIGEHPDETEMKCRADYARGYGEDDSRKPRKGGK